MIRLIGDDADLQKAFLRSTKSAQRFSLGLGQIVKASVGFLGVQKAAQLTGNAVRAAVTEFSESARVQAQTAAVIKSTGQAAGVTAKHVEELGDRMLRLSGIDDEVVKGGANVLLTFKQIRNSVGQGNAVFDRAVQATLDLSTALGRDMTSTAIQVGKALNDPIKGVTALRRAGVQLTADQEKQVKAFVKTGQIMRAQKVILRELESQVGGSAKALGETLPGRLNILRETLLNIAGSVVEKFEPALRRGADAVVEWLNETRNQERIQQTITRAVNIASRAAETFVGVLRAVSSVARAVTGVLGGLENTIKLLAAAFIAVKVARFTTALTGLSAEALVATRRVTRLRAALLRLGAIGVVAVAVEVILNEKQINKAVNDFLRGSSLSNLATPLLTVSRKDLLGLIEARKKLADLKGESYFVVTALDKVISRFVKLGDAALDAKTRIEDLRAADLAGGKKLPEFAGRLHSQIVETTKPLSGPDLTKLRERQNKFFDAAIGRKLDRVQDIGTLTGQVTELKQIAALISQRIAATKDVTRKLTLEDELVRVTRQIRATQDAITESAAAAAKEAGQRRIRAAENLLASLGLQLDRARATAPFKDDINVLKTIQAAIRAQIKEFGRTLDLQRQLFDAAQELKEARKRQRNASQFQALGLTAEGASRVPGVAALRRQLGSLEGAITGTFLDTRKTESVLNRVRKVLSGGLGAVGRDVRDSVKGILDDLNRQLKNHEQGGPLTKFRVVNTDQVLAGLGLSADVLKEARARLARLGPGGTTSFGSRSGGAFGLTPVAAPGALVVNINGDVVTPDSDKFLRDMQKRARRTTGVRSGPRAAGGV